MTGKQQHFRLPRTYIAILVIVVTGCILSRCISNDEKKDEKSDQPVATVPTYSTFAGSASCAGCHKDIYESHIRTAHHLTSQPANEKTIIGSFASGKNRYNYNTDLYISMEKKDSGLYQSVFFHGERKRDFRFDIVTGSGAKGQTFLYWDGNKLFQMPISYFTAPGQWSVSPGFPRDRVLFDKPITSRCMECHSTFAERISEPDIKNEEFDRNKILFGVDCEKCHGPGAEHVAYQSGDRSDTSKKKIINPSGFSRTQLLDMCVLCHGGSMTKTQPSFSFIPGNALADHFILDTTTAINTDNVDVHGNQFGLLRASKCFRLSGSMTCISCHDPHSNERGNMELLSSRCMSCHGRESSHFCSIQPQPKNIEKNCIDCHMPKRPSMAVTLFLEGQETPTAAMIRSHFISIYPDDTKKMRSVMGD